MHEDFADFETKFYDFETRSLISERQITHFKHRLTEIQHRPHARARFAQLGTVVRTTNDRTNSPQMTEKLQNLTTSLARCEVSFLSFSIAV